MTYPLISEYAEAIKMAEKNFNELKNLRPVLDEEGKPMMVSGKFAVVFKMQDRQTGKFHAVRCFHRKPPIGLMTYWEIEEELDRASSPYFVSFCRIWDELFVESKQTKFLVVLMDWVEGVTLDKYLREHIDDKYALEMLVYNFSQLAMWLKQQPFAHGDLKPDNIMVRPDGSLVLVDYDGMFVPYMHGEKARELGSPDFRHPRRTENSFNEYIDDFPMISILLSLKLIALHPEYLEKYGADGRLLFSAEDYADIAASRVFKKVLPSEDVEANRLASLFLLCHSMKTIARIPHEMLCVEKPQESILPTEVTDGDSANEWEDEYGVCYSKNKKRLLGCPVWLKSYTILEGTEIICDDAFSNSLYLYSEMEDGFLEEIIIPDSVTAIGEGAFFECSYLKKITIPQSVVNIKSHAFTGCKCRIICKSPHFVFEDGILYTAKKDRIISCATNKRTVTIPNTVKSIDGYAFWECSNLKKIIIPDSVTSIGQAAFYGCSALNEIILSNSLTSIEESCFCGCSALKKITIPRSVIEIKENPFVRCKCDIVCESPHYVFEDGILYTAGKDKIISCVTTGETITIPDSVESIGKEAFHDCCTLKEIIIPSSVKSIGEYAFWCCSNLQKITIPESVTSIGRAFLDGCYNLEEISIPDLAPFFKESPFFAWYSNLKRITILRNT